MTEHPESRAGRWAVRLVKWGLFAAVVYFVGRHMAVQLGRLSFAELELDPVYAGLAVLCVMGSRMLDVAIWRSALWCFGQRLSWGRTLSVAWTAMLGKYLPGKVAGLAGAAWLFRHHGVPGATAAAVVLTQTGIMVLVGLLMAVPITLWGPVQATLPWAWLWCCLLLAAGAVVLHPKVLMRVGTFFLRLAGRPGMGAAPRPGGYAAPVVLTAVSRVLAGVGVWLAARALVPGLAASWIPLFVAAMALATVAGFITVFAPAGLGVREGVLQVVLETVVGPASAVVVLGMRLLYTVVEVLLALVGLAVLRRFRGEKPAG